MRSLFSFVYLFFFNFYSQAQTLPASFHLEKQVDMANILAQQSLTVTNFTSVSEARSVINDIMEAVNVQQNFKIVSTTQIDNAAAVMYQNKRYILYNPTFITQLDNTANDKWASVSVIGHEIGHHVLGHTLDDRGSQLPKELAADKFSGLVLKRLGASLSQAQAAMRLIGSPYATATHPGERERLAAIAKGWNNTYVLAGKNMDVAVNEPAPTSRRNSYPNPDQSDPSNTNNYPGNDSHNHQSIERKNNYPGSILKKPTYAGRQEKDTYPSRNVNASTPVIVYDIKFRGTNNERYFITSQNQIVKFTNDRLKTIAHLAATRNANYPFMIYDDQQQLFINTQGNIVSEKGRHVGYITRHQ